jgi:hypothetical protein
LQHDGIIRVTGDNLARVAGFDDLGHEPDRHIEGCEFFVGARDAASNLRVVDRRSEFSKSPAACDVSV